MGHWLKWVAQAVRRYLRWSREVWRSLPTTVEIVAILVGILIATAVTSAVQPALVRDVAAFAVLLILAALLTLVWGLVKGTPLPREDTRRGRRK